LLELLWQGLLLSRAFSVVREEKMHLSMEGLKIMKTKTITAAVLN
jgi:hypothetical protein